MDYQEFEQNNSEQIEERFANKLSITNWHELSEATQELYFVPRKRK
jgi:hypothetical protein